MQLSQHFTLEEFTYSQTASRFGLDMTPTDEHLENLRALCLCMLEPLRLQLMHILNKEVGIRITSGYRPRVLNERIGGAKNSQHQFGEAADIVVVGLTPLEVCQVVKNHGGTIPFDQLIHEFGSWTHVSYKRKGGNRGQCLTICKVHGTREGLHA